MVKRTFAKRGSMPKMAIPSNLIEQRPFQSTLHRSPIQTQAEEQPDLQTQLAIAQRTTPNWSQITVGGTPSVVQTKLTVGAPGDQYEQEADRVADQVMSMPDSATQQPVQRETNSEEDEVQTKPISASMTPLVQREAMPEEEEVQTKANTLQREAMPEEEEIQTKEIAGTLQREAMPEEEEIQTKSLGSIQREEMPEEEEVQTKPLQRSSDGSLQAGSSIETQLNNSKGGGSPLPDEVRSFMEPRFGTDFSQVRVHTGSEAMQMNRDLNAQAFTHKQDVYFGAGKAPGKDALTAHELTHVVQQTRNDQSPNQVVQRFAQIAVGPVVLAFLLVAGFTIVISVNKKEVGRIANALSKGYDGVMEELQEILIKAGVETIVQIQKIEEFIRKHLSSNLNIDDFGGDTKRLAEHLARLLRLSDVGGIPPNEPEDPGNDNDNHWWGEIKTFLNNIRKATRKATRKQIMRELRKRYSEEQINDIQNRLQEAAEKMGEEVPPLFPPG